MSKPNLVAGEIFSIDASIDRIEIKGVTIQNHEVVISVRCKGNLDDVRNTMVELNCNSLQDMQRKLRGARFELSVE